MLPARLVERVAIASHRFACRCFPLLQPWERLTRERRTYQLDVAAHGISALTPLDVVLLAEKLLPDFALVPRAPDARLLAELQEAAVTDAGTSADARRRYRALIEVGINRLHRQIVHRGRYDGARSG